MLRLSIIDDFWILFCVIRFFVEFLYKVKNKFLVILKENFFDKRN